MEVEYVACVVVEVSVKLWLVHGIFVWFVCVVGKIVQMEKTLGVGYGWSLRSWHLLFLARWSCWGLGMDRVSQLRE